MASAQQVQRYLAHWFQLGKPIWIGSRSQPVLPDPVFHGNNYSQAFEQCWTEILETGTDLCYLDGTLQTIDELLSEAWEIESCARCEMPVPIVVLGQVSNSTCPCSDLAGWPNTELPLPRSAVDSGHRLRRIYDRLNVSNSQQQS